MSQHNYAIAIEKLGKKLICGYTLYPFVAVSCGN